MKLNIEISFEFQFLLKFLKYKSFKKHLNLKLILNKNLIFRALIS